MSYGFNSVDDISRAIIYSGAMKDKKGGSCAAEGRLIYDHIKSLKEENEKLKKENKSITSHRDRLLRKMR